MFVQTIITTWHKLYVRTLGFPNLTRIRIQIKTVCFIFFETLVPHHGVVESMPPRSPIHALHVFRKVKDENSTNIDIL